MSDPRCEDTLWDVACCAEAMGVTPHSARTIIGRSYQTGHPFPRAKAQYGPTRVWDPDDVRDWVANRPGAGNGPRPGRRQTPEQRLESLAGDRDYLTASQAARYLNITVDDLIKRSRRGRAPRITTRGAYLRVTLDDIHDWESRQERRSA